MTATKVQTLEEQTALVLRVFRGTVVERLGPVPPLPARTWKRKRRA